MQKTKPEYKLAELNKEATLGNRGTTIQREVPRIDLSDFKHRKQEIAEQLWQASVDIGFFQLINHDIPQTQIDEAFDMTASFFDLDNNTKAQYPLSKGTNAGWEYRAQVRPSTGTADNKESYQITVPRMNQLWPSGEELPGFKATMLAFERSNWALGMKVLSCFALKLGFTEDFFTDAHLPTASEYQSTLRLLHYLAMENAQAEDFQGWRAGAHSDFDCLTILHQKSGQGGLQVCPGKDHHSQAWTDVTPEDGVITCNIGDMLMRWSDDQLKSTLHRVRMPQPNEYLGPRYSLAFFCQANTNAIIQGPGKTYPPITADDYLRQRVAANNL